MTIDPRRFAQTVNEWYMHGYHKTQRLGQFLINRDVIPREHLPWPELFYEQDAEKVIRLIFGPMDGSD